MLTGKEDMCVYVYISRMDGTKVDSYWCMEQKAHLNRLVDGSITAL